MEINQFDYPVSLHPGGKIRISQSSSFRRFMIEPIILRSKKCSMMVIITIHIMPSLLHTVYNLKGQKQTKK